MMLEMRHLDAGYHGVRVIHDVSMHVDAGEIVALFGRNGVGRSTLAKAIIGLVERRGSIELDGMQIGTLRTCDIARAGVGYVAEARDVFPTLSVAQNLLLGMSRRERLSSSAFESLYELFPRLRHRANVKAGVLSGGEQQMLSIARAWAMQPRVLIIDEPSEGLAPRVVDELGVALAALAARGTAVLLIEQRAAIALELARRVYVMGRGRSGFGEIVFAGSRSEFVDAPGIVRQWLSV